MYYRLECCILLLIFTILRQFTVNAEQQQEKQQPNIIDKNNPPSIKLPECKDTDVNYVKCNFNTSCVYGELDTIHCHAEDFIKCKGPDSFEVTYPCLYCWQLPEEFYSCGQNTTCKLNTKYLTTCNVNSTTYCMGKRQFLRFKECNISNGHKWSMALTLSILFGGFGIDRFYLGHWQEGVGKLFSFGGFGVWTLIDAILISIGYLKPADAQYE